MPTYVYECRVCNQQFEVEQRITDERLTDCSCGEKSSLVRLIQPTAVLFKGSGFYVNDSTPSPRESQSSSSSKESAPTPPKDQASDSKPPVDQS